MSELNFESLPMQTPYLFGFGGLSGVGKDTQANKFKNRHGLFKVKSVSTRQPRYEGEDTYYFISEEEYDKANLCQHAGFSGCRYGATVEEVDKSSIFVLCPEGLPELLECYTKRPVVMIFMDSTDETRRTRMAARGDSPESIENRIKHDAEHYGTFCDKVPIHVIDANRDEESIYQDILAVMKSYCPDFDWTPRD